MQTLNHSKTNNNLSFKTYTAYEIKFGTYCDSI